VCIGDHQIFLVLAMELSLLEHLLPKGQVFGIGEGDE